MQAPPAISRRILQPSWSSSQNGLPKSAAAAAKSEPSKPIPFPSPAAQPRERALAIAQLLFVGDAVVAFASVCVGFGIRTLQRGDWEEYSYSLLTGEGPAVLWGIGGGLVFPWLMLMQKTYEVANVYRMHFWARNLLKSVLLWPMIMLAFVGLTREFSLAPRLGFFYATAALVICQVIWRLLIYSYLVQPRVREVASSRVIIVGWNKKAAAMRTAMRNNPSLLGEILGCVPAPGGTFAETPPRDVPVLGQFDELPQLVRACEAHSIILADVACPASSIRALVEFCQREYLDFKLVPEYFPALASRLQVKLVGGVPLLGIVNLPLDLTYNRMLKRAVDLIGGCFGFVLSAPLVCLFCWLVWLEERGPVIYRQIRTSQSGRTFYIYKIRSMRINAEASTGAVWCKKDDPRRLRIGTFMRRWNIDELPQFYNVIRGDMSLVGPRPERPELIEQFKDAIANYNVRHAVRAGLTGYAQIHGYRGDTDLCRRIELDLYYLENWSLMLDFYCLVATFFKFKNAH